jgi:2-isopropylmalate synthase
VDRYELTISAGGSDPLLTNAKVTVRANDRVLSAAVSGHGALNTLHQCLQTCLANVYPQIKLVHLTDYKVRLLDAYKGTTAKVRVLTEWSDQHKVVHRMFPTMSLKPAEALLDAIRLELMRLVEKIPMVASSKATVLT